MKRLVFTLLLAGCASAGGQRGWSASRIEASEIPAAQVENALQLVQRLRPRWLDLRAAHEGSRLAEETVILVYVDDARAGEVEVLRDIPVTLIESMRVLNAAEMTALVGLEPKHVERIIAVKTVTRK